MAIGRVTDDRRQHARAEMRAEFLKHLPYKAPERIMEAVMKVELKVFEEYRGTVDDYVNIMGKVVTMSISRMHANRTEAKAIAAKRPRTGSGSTPDDGPSRASHAIFTQDEDEDSENAVAQEVPATLKRASDMGTEPQLKKLKEGHGEILAKLKAMEEKQTAQDKLLLKLEEGQSKILDQLQAMEKKLEAQNKLLLEQQERPGNLQRGLEAEVADEATSADEDDDEDNGNVPPPPPTRTTRSRRPWHSPVRETTSESVARRELLNYLLKGTGNTG